MLLLGKRLDEPEAVLVVQEASSWIAFAELSTRDDIKELAGKKVGSVEGLYVVPSFRHSRSGAQVAF